MRDWDSRWQEGEELLQSVWCKVSLLLQEALLASLAYSDLSDL